MTFYSVIILDLRKFGISFHRIRSAINNAKRFIEIQKEYGSFYDYILSFLPDGKPVVNNYHKLAEIPASTPISDVISKDIKRRGFTFFGTTICYAFLQSMGFVNDHLVGCKCHPQNTHCGISTS